MPQKVRRELLSIKLCLSFQLIRLFRLLSRLRRTGLSRDLKSAQKSLAFLEQTVRMVETRPSQFKHIDASDLKSRQRFVSNAKHDIETMAATLSSDSVRLGLQAAERKQLPRLQQSTEEWQRENSNFILSEQQRQQEIIEEQDQNLDILGKSVAQLGEVAVGINQEIGAQNK